MQTKNTPKIAVIGLGSIGRVVAANLVSNKHPVIVADRNPEKAAGFAAQSGNLARALSISEAIREADIIIPAIWFSAFKDFFYQYDALLQGKIIIDPSNPIAMNEKGGFDKVIGQNESAGQINQSLLPEGAKLAKALGTLAASTLSSVAGQKPEPAVLFYATDDTEINAPVESLIKAVGFEPLRVGGLDQSIRIEVFGNLHEFALGKALTVAEALPEI